MKHYFFCLGIDSNINNYNPQTYSTIIKTKLIPANYSRSHQVMFSPLLFCLPFFFSKY